MTVPIFVATSPTKPIGDASQWSRYGRQDVEQDFYECHGGGGARALYCVIQVLSDMVGAGSGTIRYWTRSGLPGSHHGLRDADDRRDGKAGAGAIPGNCSIR